MQYFDRCILLLFIFCNFGASAQPDVPAHAMPGNKIIKAQLFYKKWHLISMAKPDPGGWEEFPRHQVYISFSSNGEYVFSNEGGKHSSSYFPKDGKYSYQSSSSPNAWPKITLEGNFTKELILIHCSADYMTLAEQLYGTRYLFVAERSRP